jgi:serine/threonine protein kinase
MIKPDELIQNRYRIVRLLGSGGFGAVYLAEDVRLGRAVAIKEMDVARLAPDERPIAEQLFEREARMLASLDHPGLTRIWDYFQLEQRAFLVMEYVPGQTLRELLIKRGGPLDEPFVIECAIQLCAVLHYLHTRRPQVIFRDLKPANVMMVEQAPGADGEEAPQEPAFRLIDFGIARLFKPEQAGDTLIIGTPGYAPPEQYGQGQTDQRSDIYSLGATLHQLLSGLAPSSVPPPPLSSMNPGVAPALARVISRATALDPANRYQNAEELRQDLLAIKPARLAPPQPPQPQIARRPSAPKQPYHVGSKTATQLPPPTRAPAPPTQSSPMPMIMIVVLVLGLVILGTVGLRAFSQLAGGGAGAPSPVPTVPAATQEWLLPGVTGKIAFGQRTEGGFDIWVAGLGGQPAKQITNDRLSYSPAWSADGTRIALTHDRDIYIGTPSNPLEERLDLAGRAARYPVWSPDGRKIALATSGDGEGSWQLTIVDLDSRQISFPPAPQNIGGIAWAPGKLIAFAAKPAPDQPQDIFVLDESGVARNITDTPEIEEDLPGWAPNGRQMAFAASPAGADKLGQRQIVAINVDGSGRTQLTSGPGPHTNPVWSPDGKWIAYVAQENSPDWQVWAMRANGSEPRVLTFGAARKFYLAWAR